MIILNELYMMLQGQKKVLNWRYQSTDFNVLLFYLSEQLSSELFPLYCMLSRPNDPVPECGLSTVPLWMLEIWSPAGPDWLLVKACLTGWPLELWSPIWSDWMLVQWSAVGPDEPPMPWSPVCSDWSLVKGSAVGPPLELWSLISPDWPLVRGSSVGPSWEPKFWSHVVSVWNCVLLIANSIFSFSDSWFCKSNRIVTIKTQYKCKITMQKYTRRTPWSMITLVECGLHV